MLDFWKKFLSNLSQLFLVKFLVSPRVAASLIALVTFFSLLGVFIPQKFIYPPEYMEEWSRYYPTISRFAEAVGLTNLFYSWWFLSLLFLTFLSLFLCTLLRLKPTREKTQKLSPLRVIYLKKKPDLKSLVLFFSRRFYRAKEVKEGKTSWLYVCRFESRFFSVIFHFGMAILLLAITADKLSGLNGTALLTEGETFTEKHFDYETLIEAPFFFENHQFFQVRLEDLIVEYEGNVLTDTEARVSLIDEDKNLGRQEAVKVNYPLSYNGFSFLINRIGFSPLIELVDREGKVLLSSYVSLAEERKRSFKDYVQQGEFKVWFELFPNTVNPKRVYQAQLPRLDVEIKKGNKVLWQGKVYQNEVVETPLGFLSFRDLRYWVLFQVTYNPLLPLIFFGFFLSILGLVVRLLLFPVVLTLEIRPRRRGFEVALGGMSRLGKAAVERELKKIERHLNQVYN